MTDPTPGRTPAQPDDPTATAYPQAAAHPAGPGYPTATAYPQATVDGQPIAAVPAVPARSRRAWPIVAAVAGGVLLLGVGFAGGLGTGLLIGNHRSTVDVVDSRVGPPMMGFDDQDGDSDQGFGTAPDRGNRSGGTGSDSDNGTLLEPSPSATAQG